MQLANNGVCIIYIIENPSSGIIGKYYPIKPTKFKTRNYKYE